MAKRRKKGPTRARKGAAASERRSRRPLVAGAVALVLAAAAVGAALALRGGDGEEGAAPAATSPAAGIESCQGSASEAEARECFIREIRAMVEAADDPAAAVEQFGEEVRAGGNAGFIAACHGLMHTVGREYARDHELTLATLMDALPRSNDAACAAGFAHGLVTGVAPQINVSDPEASAEICAETETRYQRYSCIHGFGHAFMRLSEEQLEPALRLCDALGADAASDCAQGAFHDYWFAVSGLDDTSAPDDSETDPRVLCGAQAERFVRQCWYRAFIERPPAGAVDTPVDLLQLCDGLAGVQREGCVTAASVVGPSDPRAQMAICAGLRGGDAVACVHGVKVQNFLEGTTADYLELIGRCDLFSGKTATACYRWLGKTIAVVTNGAFADDGCVQLNGPPKKACQAGARELNGPLVTFS
jgi:hypothetical protein